MTAQPSRVPLTPAALRRQAACRELCRVHGSALVAIAQLVLDSPQDICEVVAETIAAECQEPVVEASGDPRKRLARSVFNRSRGRLVTRERFGEPPGVRCDEVPSVFGGLSEEARAVVALTIFGRHGLSDAATVLRVPPATVLRQLGEALLAAQQAVGAVALPGWTGTGPSTGDSRRRQPRLLVSP
jgi:hypothetical protein